MTIVLIFAAEISNDGVSAAFFFRCQSAVKN